MRRAREIWVQIIRQFEGSGLTQAEFARQRGIPAGTLAWWIHRLRRDGEEAPPVLPVRVVGSPAPTAREQDGETEGPTIEVVLGDGLRLRFPAGTPAAVIAELVTQLRARC
jgi:transposase-like protein